ncbi:tyrosinase-like isoform X2 [Paramuricea clavata]|uniref:Tyrosinase-like isoform X2 n=1 Tax=Paramuricea clavata TaxID=317549 RepID=A0A7D9HKT2_PARCT|nr:tyrosinase-like isoform X2 [Paramuricea clavata]
MACRKLFVLSALLVATGFSSCEKNFNAEELSKDDAFRDETSTDEISKRAVQSAKTTFNRLKSTFVGLAEKKGARGRPRFRGRPSSTSYKIDMVFVMDRSGSIGRRNFNLEKQFVANLIEYFPIFPARTRVAIVTYSTLVKLEFNFNKYINKECLRKGIQDIRYTGGMTATGTALQYVRNSLIFNAAAGARSGAKKVVFVLTDSKSNRGVTPGIPAGQLKSAGVIIFALGITYNIRQSELLAIATSPNHVFHVANYAVLNQVTQAIRGDLSKKCYNGQTVYDECGRKCRCLNGKLVKCCRLRREFTDMSYTERVRYINTVKTASTNPAYKPQYDTLLTLHKTIFFSGIHDIDFFLPWHRWYILQYENLLQQIDCRVTVPYWDWSLVGANPFSSSIWNTDFFNFEQMLRIQFHDLVHCRIDGKMCTIDSATAPEFFLHHGFVDKIWWDWQKQSNAHKFNTYFLTQAGLMTSTPYRSKDFLDLNNQPGCVCAEYVNPRNVAYGRIKVSQLKSVARLPLPPLSNKAAKLFRTSSVEIKLVTRLRVKIKPRRTVSKSALHGSDAKLGIKLSEIGQGD